MAISKTVARPDGAQATYWAITSMQAVLTGTPKLNVYLGGFASQAYLASGNPILTRFFQFSAADLGGSDVTQATTDSVYAAILSLVNETRDDITPDILHGATSI